MEPATIRIRKQLDREVKQLTLDISYVLGSEYKKLTFSDFLSNKMLLVRVIRHGIPYSFFNLIQDFTPFSEKDWSNLLDMSTKSLQRYKSDARVFKPIHAEKIIEMAEVTEIGVEVFGDMEKFRQWLHTPNFALGKMPPIDLLADSYGKDLVISELNRINHGIFA
ncbi:antitoxin Xre/MbcA/ParS toxin-binding domain-containing protein [Flavihumibacter solisilvae]|jgi:putative toxin-antitoxin system antitoxin component (TIGR02293 family)|uniref:Antitoxin n=1 Tax=Flavihumibacter solisilvae TaxID=1349421 RepID=A0A0C1L476_9BACT|nr:antitoxin Xre/MbcA/ParS toxin-binding domain-containing protein [Flavihumibacter solisilvae]KIC94401.1 antitoxin [Flavihumibacter solisilvae]